MTMTEHATREVLTCTVNGAPVEAALDDRRTLLDLLRDDLGITSPKNGCQPQAQCGCCTVLVDDRPMLSCTMKLSRVAGKSVTTLEGLDDEHRAQIANSFVHCGGVQCGFCIPGFAMRGVGLCEKNASPTRGEIEKAVRPHLCRCTGYKQVIDSIELYSKVRRGEAEVPQP